MSYLLALLLLIPAAALAVTDDIFVWLKWDAPVRYNSGEAVPSDVQLGIGYRIHYSSDGETWAQIAEIAPNGVNIVQPQWRGDITVDFDVENKARVTAYIGLEETEPSNEVVVPLPDLENPRNADIPITIHFD